MIAACGGGVSPATRRRKDGLVYQKLCLAAQLPLHHVTADVSLSHLSTLHPIFPSLLNKTQRYLNSLTWGTKSCPAQREQSTVFATENRGLGLEGGDSHLNCFTLRIHICPQKSREAILRFPSWHSPHQSHVLTKGNPGEVQLPLGTYLTQ